VNIKAMLMRLESALNRNDLVDQLILWPGTLRDRPPEPPWPEPDFAADFGFSLEEPDFELADRAADPQGQAQNLGQALNFVVGYNSSPKSHAALDLTLWIAHQTRLVTRQPVVVQVVYVLESAADLGSDILGSDIKDMNLFSANLGGGYQPESQPLPGMAMMRQPAGSGVGGAQGESRRQAWSESTDWAAPACALMPQPVLSGYQPQSQAQLGAESLGFADRVLWQARCLANEWRGSLETHLRFGNLGQELCQVVQEQAATLLILGCHTPHHPLLQQWGQQLPCPILGIPQPEPLDE
jgi:nucleotide-binding universal stress UspA family protein